MKRAELRRVEVARVEVARDEVPTDEVPRDEVARLDDVFDALGDPVRRSVVQLLGDGPRRAGELADVTGTDRPRMSRHLRVLLAAGLVVDERIPEDARARVFRLRPESIAAAQAWLDQIKAQWDEQLASFKRHVEGGISQ